MLYLLLATVLPFFEYINVPVAEMRESANPASEIVSQGFYSQPVKSLEESGDWLKIETTFDHYTGWIKKDSVVQRKYAFLSEPSAIIVKVNRCAAHLYSVEDTIYGPLMTLPFESHLELLEPKEQSNSRWLKVSLVDGSQAYIQRGDVTFKTSLLTRKEMVELSFFFLDLPYTWGGCSSFGYDCSAFVQMLYRQMGFYIPRDAKQQILWEGFQAISRDKLQPGDLVFFGLEEDKIRHVGVYLDNGQFINATVAENAPYIHVSKLSDPDWNGSGRFKYVAFRTLKPDTLPKLMN